MDGRSLKRAALHARVWRWHFFAGLFVAPLGIILALSGSLYLFNPQLDAWLQRSIDAPLARGPALPADALAAAAVAAVPRGSLRKWVLPRPDDASVRVQVAAGDGTTQIVWVERATGAVVRTLDAASHPMQLAKKLHGELLAGRFGSAFVELAACWMIVLLLSGAYLAWPRHKSWREVLLPGLDVRSRRGLRALHAAGGLWLSGFILVFLISGLPWTGIWGEGFRRVRALAEPQRAEDHSDHASRRREPGEDRVPLVLWTSSSDEVARHEPDAAVARNVSATDDIAEQLSLEEIVQRAEEAQLAPPVEILPPQSPSDGWTVQSMTQRRPDRVTLVLDRTTGAERTRTTFADVSRLDQAVSLGIAFHEGQLFGPLNQALGVLIAIGVLGLCSSGLVMWWRRRPEGRFGVPPLPVDRRLPRALVGLIVVLAVMLPLVGVSLLVVATLEQAWQRLGLRAAARAASRAS